VVVVVSRMVSLAIATTKVLAAMFFAIGLYIAALGTGVYLHEYRRAWGLP
jgi:ABC-type phosphate transport system permease subunit